jgi:hypothetical protein
MISVLYYEKIMCNGLLDLYILSFSLNLFQLAGKKYFKSLVICHYTVKEIRFLRGGYTVSHRTGKS